MARSSGVGLADGRGRLSSSTVSRDSQLPESTRLSRESVPAGAELSL